MQKVVDLQEILPKHRPKCSATGIGLNSIMCPRIVHKISIYRFITQAQSASPCYN